MPRICRKEICSRTSSDALGRAQIQNSLCCCVTGRQFVDIAATRQLRAGPHAIGKRCATYRGLSLLFCVKANPKHLQQVVFSLAPRIKNSYPIHFVFRSWTSTSLNDCTFESVWHRDRRQACLLDEISLICAQGTYGIHAGSANRRNCCGDEDGREHREKNSGVCGHIVGGDAE
jgi:hypothetical protein